jgi:hypothetical protein
MIPLHRDPHFDFRFAADRIILASTSKVSGPGGRRVSIFKIEPESGERLGLLATATVGEGGWVDLNQPVTLAAIADPQHERHEELLEWRGPFDPEAFDAKEATKEMRKVM